MQKTVFDSVVPAQRSHSSPPLVVPMAMLSLAGTVTTQTVNGFDLGDTLAPADETFIERPRERLRAGAYRIALLPYDSALNNAATPAPAPQ